MNRIFLIICACFFLVISISKAQVYIGNFVGNDSKTINGLVNYEIPIGIPIPIKRFNDNHKIIFTPSYTYSQTYFSDKWVFSTDGNTTSYALDPNPNHEYKKSIFSHQSKIRTWAWQAWLGLESKFGKVTTNLFYSPSFIQVGSFRRKYIEDNEVIKIKERFKDKADFYNVNRFQHRIQGAVTVYGIGFGAYLNLTPYFKKTSDIDLKKFGITLVIRQDFFEQFLDFSDFQDEAEKKNPDIKQMKY